MWQVNNNDKRNQHMNASFWNYPSKQKSWPIDEEMESLGEVIHPLDNIGGFDVRPGFIR